MRGSYPGRTAGSGRLQLVLLCTSSWRCRRAEPSHGTDWSSRDYTGHSRARAPLPSGTSGQLHIRTLGTIPSDLQTNGEEIQTPGTTASTQDRNVNSKFLYSAVSSPRDCSKTFTLYFPETNRHHLKFSGKHPAICYNCTHYHHCPDIYLYSWVIWSNVEWKHLSKVLTPQHRIWVENPKLYPWATALYVCIKYQLRHFC